MTPIKKVETSNNEELGFGPDTIHVNQNSTVNIIKFNPYIDASFSS